LSEQIGRRSKPQRARSRLRASRTPSSLAFLGFTARLARERQVNDLRQVRAHRALRESPCRRRFARNSCRWLDIDTGKADEHAAGHGKLVRSNMRSLIFSITSTLLLVPNVVSAQALSLGPAARPLESITSFAPPMWEAPIGRQSSSDVSVTGSLGPARARLGLPAAEVTIVRRCRRAVVGAALPYGVAHVDALGAGSPVPVSNGYVAPIEVNIVYARGALRESRQATIECFLDTAGRVKSVR
jgi:hypothetical protein